MNSIGAAVAIGSAFWALIQHNDTTLFVAWMGWACAFVNRAELERYKREHRG